MAKEQKNKASNVSEQMQTGITFNDLVLARNVIQVASQRGAFTDPKEYQEIGALYQKLDTFISSVQKQAQAAKAEEASDKDTEDTKED